MVDESMPIAVLRLIVDIIREAPGAIIGGFLAYLAHEAYHIIWRRPGHILIRKVMRRAKKP